MAPIVQVVLADTGQRHFRSLLLNLVKPLDCSRQRFFASFPSSGPYFSKPDIWTKNSASIFCVLECYRQSHLNFSEKLWTLAHNNHLSCMGTVRELPDFPRYSQIAILCKSCIVGAAKTSRSCGLTVTYEMLGSISSQWTVLQEIVVLIFW